MIRNRAMRMFLLLTYRFTMKVATRIIALVSAKRRAIERVMADRDSMKEKKGHKS